MKSLNRLFTATALALTAGAAFAQAPSYNAPSYQQERGYYQGSGYQNRAALPQQELDQILAPVALYPDQLLSQLLMAATHPADVAQAAQWARSNTGYQGDDAVRAVENEPWDPSVKSLVAFPELLKAMGDQPQWTARLGQAFLADEQAVMQTVQQLRGRADQAGNLRSSEQIDVQHEGDNYVIQPPSQEQVYVPYYDPRTVYGAWWWPAFQPIFWNPWPGYAYYRGVGFGWGRPVYLSSGFFYGGFNWGHHYVSYSSHRPYYYRGADYSRGWNNGRHDTGHYVGGRGPGQQRPRYDGNGGRNYYNPSVRTVAPRYNMDSGRVSGGRVRTDPAQRVVSEQRSVSVPQSKPMQAAPRVAGQLVQRAAPTTPRTVQVQPHQRVAQPQQNAARVERSGDQRGENRRGNSDGGNRGRDR